MDGRGARSSFSISPQTRSGGRSSREIARHRARASSSRRKSRRAENCTGAEDAKTVVCKASGVDDPQQAPAEVAAAVERVQVVVGQRIPGDRVDGEIAAAGGLLDRHRRVAGDVEPAVTATGLRFAAGKRHVDIAALVDLKALAHRFDATERLEQVPEAGRVEAVDLEIDVLGVAPHQAVADPAADDQRASTRVAHRGGNRACALERVPGVDAGHSCQRSIGGAAVTRSRPNLVTNAIAEAWSDRIQQGQATRGAVGVDLGRGMRDRAGDRRRQPARLSASDRSRAKRSRTPAA